MDLHRKEAEAEMSGSDVLILPALDKTPVISEIKMELKKMETQKLVFKTFTPR